MLLKELKIYDKTDIYILGDHGDSYFAFSESSGDDKLQHACTPFHTSCHVPLLAKSNYLKNEDRHDLVSQIDLYSTILNSLNINYKKNINGFDVIVSSNYSLIEARPDYGANIEVSNTF